MRKPRSLSPVFDELEGGVTAMIAFGCVMVVLPWHGLDALYAVVREARASRNWPATTATVAAGDTRVAGKPPDGVVVPRIRYRYVVDGIPYESERITVADEGYPQRCGCESGVGTLCLQHGSTLRFKPARPTQAVLSSDLPTDMPPC